MNEDEDLNERREMEALLPILHNAKLSRNAASNNYDQYSEHLRRYMESRAEYTFSDPEGGYTATLSPGNAIHNYNVAEMPDNVIIALAQAGCLTVNHAALQKLNLPRLKEEARRFYHPGEGARRLSIEKS